MFNRWPTRSVERERVGREKRATRGDTRDRTRAREDTRVRTKTRGDTRGDTKGRTRARESTYKGKGNPQNPFVASAQANQAAAAAAQAGPPYEFRGWVPALQAAAPVAAAAAPAAAAQSADVREMDAQKGAGKGQKGKIPVTPQKRVGCQDWLVGRSAEQQREWEQWGEDQGPRPPTPGGPQGHIT